MGIIEFSWIALFINNEDLSLIFYTLQMSETRDINVISLRSTCMSK